MKPLKIILFFLLLCPLFGAGRHAMWVVRDALKSEAQINQVIATAVSNNISDLFVQVRALGQCYYPSSIEPIVDGINENYDPLRLIIAKAARYKIRIHAWLNAQYVWSGNLTNIPLKHILHSAKSGILRSADMETGTIPTFQILRKAGIEGYYIDPANKAGRIRLIKIVKEILAHYKIDGIHLDYFRYPAYKNSFSPSGRTDYRLKYQVDPINIIGIGKNPISDIEIKKYQFVSQTFKDQLRNNLTGLLAAIKSEIDHTQSAVELSVAVKPNVSGARINYFQDWMSWVKGGLVDFVAMMNYRTDWAEFTENLSDQRITSHRNSILVGISTFNQQADAVRRRMNYVLKNDWAGYALFSYNHLIDNRKYMYRLQLYQHFGGNNGTESSRPAGD